jgi:hypothetical protein
MSRFDYVLGKIGAAPFRDAPFRHLWIEDLFSPADIAAITAAEQIRLPELPDDRALIAVLQERGYKAIQFPGTTTDLETYLAWHGSGQRQDGVNNRNCEGFGVTFRLQAPEPGSILAELSAFITSSIFWEALAARFGIDLAAVRRDAGIQKYLDGYEISPHPDVRAKALTFMANINPAPDSELLDFHTHYMRFKRRHDAVRVGWESDLTRDRGWVSWDWCETAMQQRANNSMVIFAPSNDTLHAVRARYDHLKTQRTQCYGNLWFIAPQLKPAG